MLRVTPRPTILTSLRWSSSNEEPGPKGCRTRSCPAVKNAASGPVAQIDVIKNSTIVYTVSPGKPTAKFTFRDDAYHGEDSYYYVRVIQSDKNMAWASPIWVKKKP